MSRDSAAEAARWLEQAKADWAAARLLADGGHSAQACFLSQQVAEKALKALLYAHGAEMILGHSVASLCEEVRSVAPELGSKCPDWAELDQYYIPTRYPDALPGGIPSEVFGTATAAAALQTAAEITRAVEGCLSSDQP